MMKKIIVSLVLLAAACTGANAQSWTNRILQKTNAAGWEFGLKAGFNFGGSSPLPLPVEIREIESFNPTLGIQFAGIATKWFGPERKWGLAIGISFDNKNMITRARVKNYSMEIIGGDGNRLAGNWTGYVRTNVRNDYLSLPVMASWKVADRWVLQFGPYASVLLNGNFSGEVYDGYLREGNPTGDKIVFTGGAVASYDFSSELRRFLYGLQLGTEWAAFPHLRLCGSLSWGLNDIFRKDFDTVSFSMYPIYLTIGFGYDF